MNLRLAIACTGISLFAVGCHREPNQAKAVPQLLRYRWVAGREIHYTMTIADPNHGKPFISEREIDVKIGPVNGGRTTAEVRLGCKNGVCVPQFATIPIDSMGGMPEDAPSCQFPVFQLPRDPVLPGATWTKHQVYESGRGTLDSHFQFIGLVHIGNRTLAKIDDRFVLSKGSRKCPGTRSVLLDLSDGMAWQSTAKSDAEVTWQRL